MSNDKVAATFGSWWQGKDGVWEYMTTLDQMVFYDHDAALHHQYFDLDDIGDVWVRPFGSDEWGWYRSGKPAP